MFKNYLLNLYKNLNLYKFQKSSDYIDLYKNKIMTGGEVPDHYKQTFLNMFRIIKADIERIKQSGVPDYSELVAKMRTLNSIIELYDFYLRELIYEHEYVNKEISDLDTIARDPKITQIQTTINDINQIFGDLLAP